MKGAGSRTAALLVAARALAVTAAERLEGALVDAHALERHGAAVALAREFRRARPVAPRGALLATGGARVVGEATAVGREVSAGGALRGAVRRVAEPFAVAAAAVAAL